MNYNGPYSADTTQGSTPGRAHKEAQGTVLVHKGSCMVLCLKAYSQIDWKWRHLESMLVLSSGTATEQTLLRKWTQVEGQHDGEYRETHITHPLKH
jgi:hypothetical protein